MAKTKLKHLPYSYSSTQYWKKANISHANLLWDTDGICRRFMEAVGLEGNLFAVRGEFSGENELTDKLREIIDPLVMNRETGINWKAMGVSHQVTNRRRKKNPTKLRGDVLVHILGGLSLIYHYYHPMTNLEPHRTSPRHSERGAMQDYARHEFIQPYGKKTEDLFKGANYRAFASWIISQKPSAPDNYYIVGLRALMRPVIKVLQAVLDNTGINMSEIRSRIKPGIMVRGGGLLVEAVINHDGNIAVGNGDDFFTRRGPQEDRWAGDLESLGIFAFQSSVMGMTGADHLENSNPSIDSTDEEFEAMIEGRKQVGAKLKASFARLLGQYGHLQPEKMMVHPSDGSKMYFTRRDGEGQVIPADKGRIVEDKLRNIYVSVARTEFDEELETMGLVPSDTWMQITSLCGTYSDIYNARKEVFDLRYANRIKYLEMQGTEK